MLAIKSSSLSITFEKKNVLGHVFLIFVVRKISTDYDDSINLFFFSFGGFATTFGYAAPTRWVCGLCQPCFLRRSVFCLEVLLFWPYMLLGWVPFCLLLFSFSFFW